MNSERVAQSYDAVTRAHSGGRPDDAVPYRHFNNFVKKHVITEAVRHFTKAGLRLRGAPSSGGDAGPPKLDVLDIASGRGGDLRKFLFVNRAGRDAGQAPVVGSIHGYDISAECVAEASKRAAEVIASNGGEGQLGTVTYTVADTFSPDFWTDLAHRQEAGLVPTFDLVSCFFALHYGCRSRESLRAIIAGVAKAMRPGGVFFGTIVDSQELTKRLLEVKAKPARTRNDLFNIRVCADDAKSPDALVEHIKSNMDVATCSVNVGFHYYFALEDLVDADEFAIPFAVFEDVALEYGLVPVTRLSHSFADLIFAWNGDKTKLRAFGNAGELAGAERDLVTLYRTFCFEKASSN